MFKVYRNILSSLFLYCTKKSPSFNAWVYKSIFSTTWVYCLLNIEQHSIFNGGLGSFLQKKQCGGVYFCVYGTAFSMPIQKLPPPVLLFSDFAGWVNFYILSKNNQKPLNEIWDIYQTSFLATSDTRFFIRNLCGGVEAEVPYFFKWVWASQFLIGSLLFKLSFFTKKKVLQCILDLNSC